MSRSPRHDRGRETEFAAAQWYRDELWPQARARGRSEAGADVYGPDVPVDVEVKARADFHPTAWIQQSAKRQPGGFVLLRPNGYGTERIGDWLVIRKLSDDTELLRQAGYDCRPGAVRSSSTVGTVNNNIAGERQP